MRTYNGISEGFMSEPKFNKFSKFLNITKSTDKMYLSLENKHVGARECLKIRKANAKLKFRTMRKRVIGLKRNYCAHLKKNPTVHGKSKLQLEECQLVTEHRKGENLPN